MQHLKDKNELKEIYDTLVSVCNAIASVINVDVTIVDRELRRITGTGRYVASIGEQLSSNCVFAYALEKGEKLFIEDPREHVACKRCEGKQECKEYAQVCCPIKAEESVIGIIGLIAFNESQRDTIISQKDNMLDFLSNMCDLIAAKIKENRKAKKVSLMAGELEILVNSMDMGVISTDENGIIQRYNSIANEMFGLKTLKGRVENITELLGNITISSLKEGVENITNKEFFYKSSSCKVRGLYNAKPVKAEGAVTGFVFTFNKLNELIKVVNDLAGISMSISFEDILGQSREIHTAKEYAKRIAKSSSTVLIQGESGTGKELFARAIHYASDRRAYPFVAINCTAIPENLIESELFGYDEGAFTGARKGGKLGKFELASKGTIFLDEIGDMPLNLQAKLLRVLQEGRIVRVGGNTEIPVNVRVIAASNKLLEQKVREREFREDLFYRLNVIPIYLPALRERLDDIEVLAFSFLGKYNEKLGRSISSIEQEVLAVFKSYQWNGNVRELENVVEYSVNMCSGDTIKLSDLPRRLKEAQTSEQSHMRQEVLPLVVLEKQEIIRALKLFGFSNEGIIRSANALGISRATMYRKIKEYGINSVSN